MSLIKDKSYFFLLLFVTGISLAQKQEMKQDSVQVEMLEDVLITATRTKRQLSSLPLPATIVSKKDLKTINAVRLSDILNEQSGLITVPDFGGGEGIQMQGLDAAYTLILVDGVPLIGRSAGTLDLDRITVGNIKQIEIIKGASSSLYGNEALGGVINIITDTPKYGINGSIQQRTASFETYDTRADIGYKNDKFSISGFINRYSSGGFDLNENTITNTVEPFENYTLSAKATYDFSEKTNIVLSGRFFTQSQDNIASEILQGESTIDEWNLHTKLDHTFNEKWESSMEFYATNYKATEFLNDNSNNTRFSDAFFDQIMIRPELRTVYKASEKASFIGGIGYTYETLDRTFFSESPEFKAPYVYAQYDGNPLKKLNVIIGARFDNHNVYQSQFSPKLALRYEITPKLAVKGSAGYGFKAPDFRQLYFNFTNATVGYTVLGYDAVPEAIAQLEAEGQIANQIVPVSVFSEELKPESSLAINAGFDYKPTQKISIGINVFKNLIDDLIDTRIIANKTNGQNVFSYTNINEVYTQGLEFSSTWKITKNIKFSAGYQLLFAKDKTAEEAFENGEVFARENPSSPSFQLESSDYFGLFNRSRHMANGKLFYKIPKWNSNANIRTVYRSKYGIADSNGNGYLDKYDDFVNGYSIWDIAFNKTIYDKYTFGLGVDNLFNFTDPQNISNIAGRIIYGNLTIQF
ncbi:TonB-dependent receptor [Kordia algicida OT-1]|uniref:Outer membrane receptor for transport of vitamin B, putative n=1 Tax=Kordia algicida OT-1 TaxID=391587 RepID=A9E769_9FLAO|nr:TonB-dependent receptor [Kordia algicida]EDP94877.1 outer membrane receptor for transport of vitamin B, putative [Kordia algicida OT-1]